MENSLILQMEKTCERIAGSVEK